MTTRDPIADFLAPLVRLGTRFPEAEGHVLWAEGGRWAEQDDLDEGLDGDEIAYYAEGLLLEGFALIWQAIAPREQPAEVQHVLLFFVEDPIQPMPAIPDAVEGWTVVAQGRWPA